MPTIARARSRLVDDFQRQATKPQVSPFVYCLAFEHIYEFEARRRELETRGVAITDRDAIKLFSKSLPESYKPFVDAHAECDIWAEFHFNYRGQTLQIAKSTASPNVMFLPPEYHHDWIPRSQYLRDNPQYWNRYGGQATSSTPPVLGAEPANLEEAMASPEWPQWERAMHTHKAALWSSKTLRSAKLPMGTTPLESHWVFKRKLGRDRHVVGYEAQLWVSNNTAAGVHALDTTMPLGRIKSLRLVLAVAASKHMFLHRLDIDSTCLNTTLAQQHHMRPTDDMALPKGHDTVLISKPMRGLKGRNHAFSVELNNAL